MTPLGTSHAFAIWSPMKIQRRRRSVVSILARARMSFQNAQPLICRARVGAGFHSTSRHAMMLYHDLEQTPWTSSRGCGLGIASCTASISFRSASSRTSCYGSVYSQSSHSGSYQYQTQITRSECICGRSACRLWWYRRTVWHRHSSQTFSRLGFSARCLRNWARRTAIHSP